jgi:hypothetical protein
MLWSVIPYSTLLTLLFNKQVAPKYFLIFTQYLGEFYETSNPQECPQSICQQNNIPQAINDDMVQMVLSDFVATSAGYAWYNIGIYLFIFLPIIQQDFFRLS